MTPSELRALVEAATFTRQEMLDMQKPYGKWPEGLADVRVQKNRAYDQLEGLGVVNLALLLADAMEALEKVRYSNENPSLSEAWKRKDLLARFQALGEEV